MFRSKPEKDPVPDLVFDREPDREATAGPYRVYRCHYRYEYNLDHWHLDVIVVTSTQEYALAQLMTQYPRSQPGLWTIIEVPLDKESIYFITERMTNGGRTSTGLTELRTD